RTIQTIIGISAFLSNFLSMPAYLLSPRLLLVGLDRGDHRSGDLARGRGAAEVGRVPGRIGGYPLNRPHQPGGSRLLPQMFQHQAGSPEGSDGVGYALARDVQGRAVDRLEHGRE